jgi:hypothetical protein
LKISELTSVGAVDDGDNPPASLLFWKRKPAPVGGDDPEGVLMNEGTEETVVEADVGKEAPAAEVEAEESEADEFVKRLQAQEEDIAKARQERDIAVALLAEEIAKRRQTEWVAKAQPYELLLGSAETVGPVLGRFADSNPDDYAILESALNAALNRQDLTKILSEVGKDTGQTGTVEEKQTAFVKEFRMLHPEVSVAEARARFWTENPEMKQLSRERI